MTDRELMQMALDAMEDLHRTGDTQVFDLCHAPELIPALRARLAQPEPEPVAWTVRGLITDFRRDFSAYQTKTYTVPLYTAPPQREFIGLTDEEIHEVVSKKWWDWEDTFDIEGFSRAIEAKVKEKNHD